ncbi:phosphoribosylanthranilate isomerase [hydrocarbon metagenome]|uniref:phosphoribosylanthranilate isomerase n=1 Tax=hydrocarbon metagenome TaxID=938273 RepID=A0A0W8E6M8_9ZZZZ
MIRIKICGIMNREDLDLCVKAGVHTLGFVVDYPLPVPWNLNPEQARQLIDGVPPLVRSSVVTGGSVEKVMAIARAIRPDMIQLHYQETLAEVAEMARQLSYLGIKVIKALRIDEEGRCAFEIPDPVAAARALSETGITALLIDSFTSSLPGGTGVAVDLSTFRAIQQASVLPVILAGGLNSDNIGQIVREVRPCAVDVLTGVEDRPGRKSPEKVYRFMEEILAV